MKPRFIKVFRDTTADLNKNLMLVLAIAIGIFAIGTMLGGYAVLTREMARNYNSTVPASATIKVEEPNVDSKLIEDLMRDPEIQAAERRATVVARMKVGNDWMGLLLFVIDDFQNLRTNKFFRISGDWPPPQGSMLVETSALRVMHAVQGDSMMVRLADNAPESLRISGVVHDPGLAPAWQERTGYGYVTLSTLEQLGRTRGFDEIRILLADTSVSRAEIESRADRIAHNVAAQGLTIHEVRVPPPGHPHQSQMNAVLTLFIVFSFLTLFLASILVATSTSTLMTRQVREIGVMKTIGATSHQVAGLYLLMMSGLSIVAVAVAIPLSRISASVLITATAGLLNLTIFSASIPLWVTLVQTLSGIFVPLLAVMNPVLRGSRITVREAFNNYGVSQSSFGSGLSASLSRLRLFNRSFTLALRNVFRHRSRLAMTMGLLAAGGAMFMTALNVSRAWDSSVGKIYAYRHYDLELRLAEPDRSQQETLRKIAEIPGVKTAEYWQVVSMSFTKDGSYDTTRSYPDMGHGRSLMVAVPSGSHLVDFPVLDGRWLQPGDANHVVLNHVARAQMPQLKVGDTVRLSVEGKPAEWKIVGFVEDLGSPGATAYVPRDAFDRATNVQDSSGVIRVAFADHSVDAASRKAREVENTLEKNHTAVSGTLPMWEMRNAISAHMLVLVRSLLALAILMAAVGGLGLTSAMSLNVLERTRELGIMRAIGATPRVVERLVMTEGLIIGALSLLFAFGFSLLLSVYLGRFIGSMAFRIPLQLSISAPAIFEWIALVIVGSIFATLYPARRAGRLTTREALAHE